jgi:hypothetical protein
MKRLVIKEIPNESGEITQIQIVEQTHRGLEFSEKVNEDSFIHNGFILSSASYPEKTDKGLFVRGSDHTRDNRIILLTDSTSVWLKSMRKAVEAYNEYFSSCNMCIDRKCNTCDLNKE